jgi:hypothetical protein
MVPEHRTIAAFVSSMQDEIVSLCRAILRVWEEQGVLGGTHFALDGRKLSSNAAKEWRGTFADLLPKKEKLEQKVKRLLEKPARAEQEETARLVAPAAEQEKGAGQIQRLERQAARSEQFLAENEAKRGKRGKELQRNGTDNDAANMQTAHGVIQG